MVAPVFGAVHQIAKLRPVSAAIRADLKKHRILPEHLPGIIKCEVDNIR